MRKVQSHRHPWRRLGRRGSPAPAVAVHRPHLEGVDRIVVEPGDRMGDVGGANGDPASLPVDPVLVIDDRGTAVVFGRIPTQDDLAVLAHGRQVRRRIRSRRWRRWWRWRPWWWRAAAALEVGDGCGPRPKRRILRRTQAGVLDPHGREVVQIHQVQRERPRQVCVAIEIQLLQVGQVRQLGRDRTRQPILGEGQLLEAGQTPQLGRDCPGQLVSPEIQPLEVGQVP